VTEDVRSWIRALALELASTVKADSPQQFAQRIAKVESEGSDVASDALASLRRPDEDSARQAFARKHRQELSRAGLAAYDTARFTAAMLAGMRAGFVDEADAWRRLGDVAVAVQSKYGSWHAYVDAYELGRAVIASGQPKKQPPPAVPALPWKLELRAVGVAARTRYKRSKCGHCGGIKEQPSKTPWVYCDFCGELCDYDYDRAREGGAAEPSLEDAQRRRRLEGAHARGDRKLFRKLQRQELAQLVEEAPQLMPPRIGDPGYRDAWIDYMVELTTVVAFDELANQLDVAYHAVAESVPTVLVKQRKRVMPEHFPALLETFVARTDRLAQLCAATDLFDKHPDRPTPAIWRHIEHAVFAQRWLPFVDEASASALLARLQLVADFDAIGSHKRAQLPCHRCGSLLEIVQRARRVTCEHCGHRLELVAP
jgi:DNA-directed RNA polymerase subunit RPC12/RpoP